MTRPKTSHPDTEPKFWQEHPRQVNEELGPQLDWIAAALVEEGTDAGSEMKRQATQTELILLLEFGWNTLTGRFLTQDQAAAVARNEETYCDWINHRYLLQVFREMVPDCEVIGARLASGKWSADKVRGAYRKRLEQYCIACTATIQYWVRTQTDDPLAKNAAVSALTAFASSNVKMYGSLRAALSWWKEKSLSSDQAKQLLPDYVRAEIPSLLRVDGAHFDSRPRPLLSPRAVRTLRSDAETQIKTPIRQPKREHEATSPVPGQPNSGDAAGAAGQSDPLSIEEEVTTREEFLLLATFALQGPDANQQARILEAGFKLTDVRLSPSERDLVRIMDENPGLPDAELARLQGCKLGTIHARKHQIREKIDRFRRAA